LVIALLNVNVLQRQVDHDVRDGFRVTCDRDDLIVRQRIRIISKQFSTPRNGDRFRLLFRTIGYVHGASPRTRVALIRVAGWRAPARDVAIDAPMSV
jgi:hypothetical protein